MKDYSQWWWIFLGSEYLEPDLMVYPKSQMLLNEHQVSFGYGVEQTIPTVVRFTLNPAKDFEEKDCLIPPGNRLGLVFSEKLRSVLTNWGVDNIQYLDCLIEDQQKKKVYHNYKIANILGALDFLDPTESQMQKMYQFDLMLIDYLRFDERVLDQSERKIIRNAECPSIIAIQGALKVAVEQHGITGTQFILPEDWESKI